MFTQLLVLSYLSLGLLAEPNLPDANSSTLAPSASKLLIYRQEADRNPGSRQSIESLRNLALANLAAGRKSAAVAVCSELLDIQIVRTRVAWCALDVANTAYECGDYLTAERIYALVVAKGQSENGLLTASEGLTKIAIACGDTTTAEKAIDNFWRDFRVHPKAPQAILSIAMCAKRNKLPAKADELCRNIIAQWPASSTAVVARQLVILNELSTCDESEGTAKVQAIIAENTPASRQIAKAAGDMYYRQRRYAAAAEVYRKLTLSASDDEHVLAAFGALIRTDIKLGKSVEADTTLQAMRIRFPANPCLPGQVAGMGDQYISNGRPNKALPIYDYVGKTWPATVDGGRSVLRLSTKDSFNEQDFVTKLDAGLQSLTHADIIDDAMTSFVESIQREASEKMAEGRQTEARELASKAALGWKMLLERPTDENPDAILYNAGHTLLMADRPKQAVEYFERCTAEHPLSRHAASSQFMVGECYRYLLEQKAIDETEGTNKMIKAYRRVMRNYPGGPMARGAASRLGLDTEIGKGGAQ